MYSLQDRVAIGVFLIYAPAGIMGIGVIWQRSAPATAKQSEHGKDALGGIWEIRKPKCPLCDREGLAYL